MIKLILLTVGRVVSWRQVCFNVEIVCVAYLFVTCWIHQLKFRGAGGCHTSLNLTDERLKTLLLLFLVFKYLANLRLYIKESLVHVFHLYL